MTRRFWLYLLVPLLLAALGGALAFWLWTRPAPEARLEQMSINDTSITRVTPGVHPKARVAIGVPQDQALTGKQLLDLSQAGEAELVQVILPPGDCSKQQQAMDQALTQLQEKNRPWSPASAPVPPRPGAGWPARTMTSAGHLRGLHPRTA